METEKRDEQKIDEMYMCRCIQLAKNGIEGASPNPMVGAVIVWNEEIIGEGYHKKCGGPHAEVNAIASVRHPELLPESTIYVSLEPCAHQGKTPPCADLIISKHISRVVVGCQDPFAKVDGLGIKKLRDAGIEVKVGVLEKECLALNEKFITRHTHHRPHITLKWAQSQDGFIDQLRTNRDTEQPITFSTPTTQALVHEMRAHSDAILIGARTALLDNPSLTTRCWAGKTPLRLVLDLNGSLPNDLRIFDGNTPTRVYVKKGACPIYASQVSVVEVYPEHILEQILADLDAQNVQSLIVEGGARTLNDFIEQGLWDLARIETSPTTLGNGLKAPSLGDNANCTKSQHIDGRKIQFFRPKT